MARTRQTVHISDVFEGRAYADREPNRVAAVEVVKARSLVAVPMLKEDELAGAIVIYRQEPRPFTDKQIALVTTFADQAVIAIENARLFDEVRRAPTISPNRCSSRPRPPTCSRSSAARPSTCKTVLQTLVESAARLCDADKATITRQRDGKFYRAEAYGFSPEFLDHVRAMPVEPERGSATGRALLEGRIDPYRRRRRPILTTRSPRRRRLGDFRTILGVPMLREGDADRRAGR